MSAQEDAEKSLEILKNVENQIATAAGQLPSSAARTRKFLDGERNHVGNQVRLLAELIQKRRLTGFGGLVGRAQAAVAPVTRIGKAFESEGTRRLPVVDWKTLVRGMKFPEGGGTDIPGSYGGMALDRGDYYLDTRLKELRSVRNPNAVVKLNDFEVEYFRTRAH